MARVPIGDRIRSRRRSAGLTQRALAEAIGVSPAYLSLIESDKRQIGGRLLHQIAERLGVPPDTFTQLSDDRLAAELTEVSRAAIDDAAPTAAELVAFSPAWARLMLSLYERAVTAEAQTDQLSEKFQRDPQSITFAHDILSRITSIRATAEILSDADGMAGAQRDRFICAIVAESARLTTVTRQMVDVLGTGADPDAAGADVRAVDAFLSDRAYHFPALEMAAAEAPSPPGGTGRERFRFALGVMAGAAGDLIDAEVTNAALPTKGAVARARGALLRYAAGAMVMPYGPFLAAAKAMRYDIDGLCDTFGVSFEQAAHRLASLRRPGAEGIPFAFLRVDPAGIVSKRLSTRALRLPLHGACPLWIVYGAFSAAGRTLTQMVDLEGERFLFLARAVEKRPHRGAQPATRFAVMLGAPADRADEIVYADAFPPAHTHLTTAAGYECRACTREKCAQRAHGESAL
ncbi:MAG: short-chain fatty acyl-CoA regulator family protein [Pseudomonadota bacterium]